MPPLAIAGAIGLAGSLGGAALSANAAGKAADAQSQAAMYAANLQSQAANNALDFQKLQYNNSQSQLAPWLSTGTSALANLGYLLGLNNPTTNATPVSIPGMNASGYVPTSASGVPSAGISGGDGLTSSPNINPYAGKPTANLAQLINPQLGTAGSLMQGWNKQFVAPTDVTEQNDPGYQFRLKQGMDALKNNATATGTIFSGATAKGLQNYAQDYASNEYGNVYNRALGQYQQDYNIFQNNQANQFNRLAALSGVGQTAANQLSSAGQNAANNVSSTLLNSANSIGNQMNNSAAAQASGYIGAGNAWGGALSGASNNIGNLILLQGLLNKGGAGSIPVGGYQVPDSTYGY